MILRPSFTLGGSGGGIAYNREELYEILERGLDLSPVHEVLIEESVLGWKEFELEVMRDLADNAIIVCSIENFDPMGVHTGDSITVAPAQTLTDREYQMMRDASLRCLREIGVDTGGSNVQFAINPENGRMVIVEMNPRVSRSSALASKATGFPIAKIAAKLAVGYRLDEIKNDITKVTPACFEPTLDYVVVKIPRWQFEKFPGAEPVLGTQMKSVGEVMAIGRTFKQALAKGIRSLETGKAATSETLRSGPHPPAPDHAESRAAGLHPLRFRAGLDRGTDPRDHLHRSLVPEAGSRDGGVRSRARATNASRRISREQTAQGQARRRLGYAPRPVVGTADAAAVRARRKELGITAVFNRVDTCAAEFESFTPYLYSSYESENESAPSDRKKVMILGSGPNRIGQGIEFDYCCCHASFALQDFGHESIMVNCNPGNRLDRLRHQRPPVLRAADARRSFEHLRRREARRRHRPVRRADAAEPRAAAEGRRRSDHRHRSRRYRSRRRSQAVRQAARRSADSFARERHGHQRRRSLRRGAPHRISRCWCGPAMCWAAAPW